jgi:hypothetical protein
MQLYKTLYTCWREVNVTVYYLFAILGLRFFVFFLVEGDESATA